MSRMRVALVSLSTLAVGGIETHLLQLLRGLRDDADFLVVGALAEPFHSSAADLGADCVPVSADGKSDLRALARLRAIILDRRVDIVHTHDTRGGLLGRLAAKTAGCRTVHTIHTPSFFLPGSPVAIRVYQVAEGLLNRFASDRVLFVSGSIRDLYLAGRITDPTNSLWIPNGLEEEWLAAPPARDSGARGTQVLYVGRLAPEKGIRNLARAFGMAASKRSDLSLAIAGDGPERDALLEAAHAGGWRDRLILLGSVARSAVRSLLAESDIFVLPSRFESMSYTLMEAMACGLPCLATRSGGNPDLVEEGRTGMLVPPEDSDALAAAMLTLADAPSLRAEMGAAGRRKALEYTLSNMISRTREVYRAVASG